MAFSVTQLKALNGKLDRRHVQTRKVDDRDINYIEGWFAISQANTIFGFSGWDRETAHLERLLERNRADTTTCAYLARVKVRIRAGKDQIVREGTGVGSATSRNAGEAYELAIKAAETDATKRALSTFGNRFGLALYDKEQAGVTPRRTPRDFTLKDNKGVQIASELSPEAFCSGVRQVVQALADKNQVIQCRQHNEVEITRLRIDAPALRTSKGIHFADVLDKLFAARLDQLTRTLQPPQIVTVAPTCSEQTQRNDTNSDKTSDSDSVDEVPTLSVQVDKSILPISIARRARDKDHLRHVASLPCLICEEVPSHAHHITFAQSRGLALKVSDEFVVPLCAVHHNELHSSGAEKLWWQRSAIDPLSVAKNLWQARLNTASESVQIA